MIRNVCLYNLYGVTVISSVLVPVFQFSDKNKNDNFIQVYFSLSYLRLLFSIQHNFRKKNNDSPGRPKPERKKMVTHEKGARKEGSREFSKKARGLLEDRNRRQEDWQCGIKRGGRSVRSEKPVFAGRNQILKLILGTVRLHEVDYPVLFRNLIVLSFDHLKSRWLHFWSCLFGRLIRSFILVP